MSKWTRLKELGAKGLDHARDAEAQWQRSRSDAEAAKLAAAAGQAERWAAERRERIARATGPDGVIKGHQATWNGRVLWVGGGNVVHPNGRKKGVWTPVMIPLARIASAASGPGTVRVTVMDGREYRFMAPMALAEAIEDALAQL
jgi:hypothetical protein